MNDIAIIAAFVIALLIASYMGAHSNIEAEKVYLAIELCKDNGGLAYVDWSNAGCANGAEINLYRHLKSGE